MVQHPMCESKPFHMDVYDCSAKSAASSSLLFIDNRLIKTPE
jgi:hypothetical protein